MSSAERTQRSVGDLERLMIDGLLLRGVALDDAEFISHDFLEAELTRHPTHGIGRFLLLDAALAVPRGDAPEVIRRRAQATVLGNQNLGHIVVRLATQTAIALADEYGVGLVVAKDFSRFSRLLPYGRLIAERSQVGVVWASAGPPCVAPYGMWTPVFGSNPLCIGIPGSPEPFVVDVSTAEYVWGEVRQSLLSQDPLPADAFFDRDGAFTTDPINAEAVRSFGGAKGAALCAAFELLVGCLADVPVSDEVRDEFGLGVVVMAARPHDGTPLAPVATVGRTLRSAADREGKSDHKFPGASANVRVAPHRGDMIEIDIWTLDALSAFSSGKSVEIDPTDKRMN